MTTTLQDVDLDLKLAEFRINGYVLFEDMIPHEIIDRIAAAFMPLLEQVREQLRHLAAHLAVELAPEVEQRPLHRVVLWAVHEPPLSPTAAATVGGSRAVRAEVRQVGRLPSGHLRDAGRSTTGGIKWQQ